MILVARACSGDGGGGYGIPTTYSRRGVKNKTDAFFRLQNTKCPRYTNTVTYR